MVLEAWYVVSECVSPTVQGHLLIAFKVICFIITGIMLLMVMQALGELAVMYPVNGAFYTYIVRFMDPSWYAFTSM